MRILLLILVSAYITSCIHAGNDDKSNNSTNDIEIIFTTEEGMFPESWTQPDINGKAISLDTSEYERSMRIVNLALSKYPKGFISKHIKKIYVLGDLEFYGVGYGGTNSNDAVYICNKGEIMGYSDIYLEQTFHHEFSSILFREYSNQFSESKWKSINSGFEYGDGGVNAIMAGEASTVHSEKYAKMGVLSQYATSHIEEDFNSFAEQIFCASEGFWDLIAKHRKLNQKLKIIINFYNSLDSMFTEEYFREVSTQ
jgi:hypothetical protein